MADFASHERPAWCPHTDCQFVLNTQELACVGRLPEPVDHDGVSNDSRFCIKAGDVFDLQVNRGDLWGLGRLFKALYPPANHVKGREYAAQEAAALVGMAEDPEVPEGCLDDPDFERGYNEYLEEPEEPFPIAPDSEEAD